MALAADVTGPDRCRQLQNWLEQFAGQVTSINLEYFDGPHDSSSLTTWCVETRLLLPASKLTRLESLRLDGFPVAFHTQQRSISTRSRRSASTARTLPAGDSSSRPGATLPAAAGGSFLPALCELSLNNCIVKHDSFLQLSQVSRLTDLRLFEVKVCTTGWTRGVARSRVTDAVTAISQQLRGLKQLQVLEGCILDDSSALAPLSTMQHLQHVTLSTDACPDSGSNLAHLPACLTYLRLCQGTDPAKAFVHVHGGVLPQLPALREVHLAGVTLHAPSVLPKWTGLQTLELDSVKLSTDDDDIDEEAFNHSNYLYYGDTRTLLHELGKLTQLQNLASIPESQLQLLSALTASTKLKSIVLEESGEGELTAYQPIPRGALQHMFPEGRQWPALHALYLEISQAPADVNNACVDAADFVRLAAALPALEVLWLADVLEDTPGAEAVAALAQHMTSVRRMHVSGRTCDDRVAALLAQMTQLTFLGSNHTDITPAGLQKLTALTQLDLMLIRSVQMGHQELGVDGIELRASREAMAAGSPDVWQQLQRLCEGVMEP